MATRWAVLWVDLMAGMSVGSWVDSMALPTAELWALQLVEMMVVHWVDW